MNRRSLSFRSRGRQPLPLWNLPRARARKRVEEGAAEAERETPPVYGHVRTSVGADAEQLKSATSAFAAYTALDTVVVRGLASAKLEAMDRVATAAAPQR